MRHHKVSRRGQSSLELLILTGFMFLIFLGALSIGGSHLIDLQRENDRSYLIETAKFLDNEVKVAVEAEAGYYRQFELPSRLGRADYEINISGGAGTEANFTEIVLRFVNYSIDFEQTLFAPPNVSGKVYIDPEKHMATVTIKKGTSGITINT